MNIAHITSWSINILDFFPTVVCHPQLTHCCANISVIRHYPISMINLLFYLHIYLQHCGKCMSGKRYSEEKKPNGNKIGLVDVVVMALLLSWLCKTNKNKTEAIFVPHTYNIQLLIFLNMLLILLSSISKYYT